MIVHKTLITVAMVTALLATPAFAFAQSASPIARGNQVARLARLHMLADTAIAARLVSLNTVSTRLNGLVKLSSDQKSQFSTQISADVNGLNALKIKVDADTDVTILRTDYQTVYSTYRVYAEFLPQLHLLIASDTMGVTADKLSQFATKLQTRIQTAGNPAALTALLADMQAKDADAKIQYGNVETQVGPLTPQSYDANPSGTTAALKSGRAQIQAGATDLKTSWSDAKQILKALKVGTVSTPTSK